MKSFQLLFIFTNQLLVTISSLPERAPELLPRQVLMNTWTQNSRPIPGIQSWNYYESLFKPSPAVDPLFLDHYKAIARLIQTGYCPKTENWLESWTCGACLEPNSPIKNTTDLKRFMTDQSDAHGFFGVSHSIKRVFIVFEGMITHTQRKRIFQYRMKRLQRGVKAHRGFVKSWAHVKPLINGEFLSLVKQYPGYTVGLYGHSYGGGIVNIMAYMIATGQFGIDILTPQRIEIITLGSSRVGNTEFADILNRAHFKHMTRLVHSTDLVPHLPFSHGRNSKKYVHHKNEVWMNDWQSSWVNCTSQEIFGEADHCQNSVPMVSYSIKPHLSYWTRVNDYLCPPRASSEPLVVEYLPTRAVTRY